MWKTTRGKAFSVGVVSGKQGSLFFASFLQSMDGI